MATNLVSGGYDLTHVNVYLNIINVLYHLDIRLRKVPTCQPEMTMPEVYI